MCRSEAASFAASAAFCSDGMGKMGYEEERLSYLAMEKAWTGWCRLLLLYRTGASLSSSPTGNRALAPCPTATARSARSHPSSFHLQIGSMKVLGQTSMMRMPQGLEQGGCEGRDGVGEGLLPAAAPVHGEPVEGGRTGVVETHHGHHFHHPIPNRRFCPLCG